MLLLLLLLMLLLLLYEQMAVDNRIFEQAQEWKGQGDQVKAVPDGNI